MRGSGLWNPNAFRVSEQILVPVLDPGRFGLAEHRELCRRRGLASFTDRFLGRTFDAGGRQPADALADSVALHPVLQHLLSNLWTARNLGARGVQPLGTSPTHPQIQQESHIWAARTDGYRPYRP